MIYIYKDGEIEPGVFAINDVEAAFRALDDITKKEFWVDDEAKKIIHEIDESILDNNGIMHTKFGDTLIDNCSSGCKAALLVYLYSKQKFVDRFGRCSVNVSDAGDNAMEVISEMSVHINIHIHCYRPIVFGSKHGELIFRGKKIDACTLMGEML